MDNIDELIQIRNAIEKMSNYHQIEILRILSKNLDVCINENKNGTFVNLSEQNSSIIDKLSKYTIYVNQQQQSLEEQEKEKLRLQKVFFKEDKEIKH